MLYQGVAAELRALQAAGFRLVVITNQSGLARGYFSRDDLDRMHDGLRPDLARHGVSLDGIYYCPHHPEGTVPELSIACTCRKPRPGMLRQAAADLQLDCRRSWLVGDILDDIEAGNRTGCRTILVDIGTESRPTSALRRPTYVARDTAHALRIIRHQEQLGSPTDLTYLPPTWQEIAIGGK